MREVLNRRFKRAVQEKDNYLTFPDLVLVDGGKGQYSVARESLNELGLHDIPIVAIAKGKLRNSGNETFFHNGKEFKFLRNDPTLFFLQHLQQILFHLNSQIQLILLIQNDLIMPFF